MLEIHDPRPPQIYDPLRIVLPPSGHDRQDAIDALGDRIAELSARIQAATYRLLVMIREFDAAAGWNVGFKSCAHWLNWRTGLAPLRRL